jgi:hypothetical protein
MHRTSWRDSIAPDLHLGDPWFEFRSEHWLSSWLSSVSTDKCLESTTIMIRLLPFKFFPIHHSSLILSLNAIFELLTAALNSSWIHFQSKKLDTGEKVRSKFERDFRRYKLNKLPESLGRAIAQAVRRRLPIAADRVRSQVRLCGIWGGQSRTGQVFSEYFVFSCQFSFHRLFHTNHLSSEAATIGKLVADVRSGLSLTPPQETKNKKN